MDEYDIHDFPDVWSRVMGDEAEQENEVMPATKTADYLKAGQQPYDFPADVSPAGMENDAAALCRFIMNESSAFRYYAAMAARCRQSGAVFRRLSADEADHAKQLRAAYFILTGECFNKDAKAVCIISLSDALRTRFIEESKSSSDYLAAANASDNDYLKKLYSCLAADEKRHSAVIGNLIEQMMC